LSKTFLTTTEANGRLAFNGITQKGVKIHLYLAFVIDPLLHTKLQVATPIIVQYEDRHTDAKWVDCHITFDTIQVGVHNKTQQLTY